jgi:hypothetical protein
MLKAIKETLLQLLRMIRLFIDAGEDLAYAAKDITTYTREGSRIFLEEARLERAKEYQDLKAQLEQAGIREVKDDTDKAA